ncbi:MAG: hypothetical protein IKP88_15420 [Lachnospiraceae bacterium]|nr:hypothetical protein [Lachnospiraceae bacterium]
MGVSGIRIAGIAALVCVAIIIGVVIYKIYRSKVNKALAGEMSGAHIGVPAPADTFNVIMKVVMLILLVWIVISLGSISDIKQEISNMQSNVSSQISSLSSEVSKLKTDMTEVNSRIQSYNRYISDVNAEDNTCIIKHNIRLKTYSDTTAVKLTLPDGTQVDMNKKAEGIFEAETKINLFAYSESSTTFSIKEGDLSYVEAPFPENDDADEYWQLVIPSLYNAGVDIFHNSDNVSIGTVNMFSYHKVQYHIASAKLVIEKNGEVLENIDAMPYMAESLGDCSIPVDKNYDIKNDDNLTVKLVLTTEEGYSLNQDIFEKIKGSGTGVYNNRFSITDKNGKEVYKNFR